MALESKLEDRERSIEAIRDPDKYIIPRLPGHSPSPIVMALRKRILEIQEESRNKDSDKKMDTKHYVLPPVYGEHRCISEGYPYAC